MKLHRLTSIVPGPVRRTVRERAARAIAGGLKPLRISAMMRVRNEEVFIRAAVDSIVDVVDEVVLVDNASTDATPAIAAELAVRHPGKMRLRAYPHDVARVGSENERRARSAEGRRSPSLLSNYYNWCLRQCRFNYVLKWDGDMIATPAFSREMARFKRSAGVMLTLFGANLHPDRRHLVGAGVERQDQIQRAMSRPTTVGNWTSAYTDPEVRVFPRLFARYTNDFWWCESLSTPFLQWPTLLLQPQECSYLHMKYWKPDPFMNFSDDFANLIEQGVAAGPPLPDGMAEVLARFGL